MTEGEWLACECPSPMLIFLRGDLPVAQRSLSSPRIYTQYGEVFGGDGQRIRPEQCRSFIMRCLDRLLDLPLTPGSRGSLETARHARIEQLPRHLFYREFRRIGLISMKGGSPISIGHGWTDDPAGSCNAAISISQTMAGAIAKHSMAVTLADATDEDWWNWAWERYGPPDPVYRSTLIAEEARQANLLREIVGNPFRASTCFD